MIEGYEDFLALRRELFDHFDNGGMPMEHKSYEGAFDLVVAFPGYFDECVPTNEPDFYQIKLHCYVMGPARHYFWESTSLKEAVRMARNDINKWIAEEKEMNKYG